MLDRNRAARIRPVYVVLAAGRSRLAHRRARLCTGWKPVLAWPVSVQRRASSVRQGDHRSLRADIRPDSLGGSAAVRSGPTGRWHRTRDMARPCGDAGSRADRGGVVVVTAVAHRLPGSVRFSRSACAGSADAAGSARSAGWLHRPGGAGSGLVVDPVGSTVGRCRLRAHLRLGGRHQALRGSHRCRTGSRRLPGRTARPPSCATPTAARGRAWDTVDADCGSGRCPYLRPHGIPPGARGLTERMAVSASPRRGWASRRGDAQGLPSPTLVDAWLVAVCGLGVGCRPHRRGGNLRLACAAFHIGWLSHCCRAPAHGISGVTQRSRTAALHSRLAGAPHRRSRRGHHRGHRLGAHPHSATCGRSRSATHARAVRCRRGPHSHSHPAPTSRGLRGARRVHPARQR